MAHFPLLARMASRSNRREPSGSCMPWRPVSRRSGSRRLKLGLTGDTPPWHGIAPPTRHPFLQEAHAANADAMMRISARAAEELVNLVSRVVAWMKKPPPFATAPVTNSQPDPGNRPSPRWSSGITMEMRMEPTRQ